MTKYFRFDLVDSPNPHCFFRFIPSLKIQSELTNPIQDGDLLYLVSTS